MCELLYIKLQTNTLFYKLLTKYKNKSNKLIFEIIYILLGKDSERYERLIDRNKNSDYMIYQIINMLDNIKHLKEINKFFKTYINILSNLQHYNNSVSY